MFEKDRTECSRPSVYLWFFSSFIIFFQVSHEKKEVFVSINPNQICHIKGIWLLLFFFEQYWRVHMPMLICVFQQLRIAKMDRQTDRKIDRHRKDKVHLRRTCKPNFLIVYYIDRHLFVFLELTKCRQTHTSFFLIIAR